MSQEDYYNRLESQLDDIWSTASEARQKGEDPEPEIEIKLSEDMAERTEMFLEIDGLAERIRDLTEEGLDREEIAFELTDEFVNDELGDFDEPEERIDASIRTALAILTEAVVAAPLEGLQWVDTETDSSGREYIRLKYGGPIRSAGGTAQVVSVIIADYCRQHYGYDKFVPTDDEVERYVEEKDLYEREVGLQYTPGDDEVRTIIDNCPIMLDAEAVTEGEVSGYRDLDRIETNGGRGGMCLVAFEGIAQKVPKLQKYTDELGLDGWDWLTELPNASKVDDSDEEENATEGEENPENENPLADKKTKHNRLKVKPKSKFIDDTLTAGRPIFGHPSKEGAFRLRYGRSRNTGHAAGGISPATMVVLNEYIAPGTQLKTERPGKAIAASPVDSLQGPTVKLKNGEMFRIDDEEEAHKYKDRVEKILDLGEIGVPYGEFLENNAQLVPSSYVHEWWMQDAEKAGLSASNLEPKRLNASQVWNMAEKYDIPLHPKYTYMWHDISLQEYVAISNAINQSNETETGVEINDSVVGVLEDLLVPHEHDEEEDTVYLEQEHAMVLERCCDPSVVSDAEHIMEAVNEAAGIEIRERAPTRIGSRMGRPEKAERRTFQRDLNIHTLFPVGDDVDRVITDAANAKNSHNQNLSGDADENEKNDLNPGETEVQLATRLCPNCDHDTHRVKCDDCGSRTIPHKNCQKCGHDVIMDDEDMGETECPECGKEVKANKRKSFNIKERLDEALDILGERKGHFDELKGVEGLVSQEKLPEPLEKGILRAKYDVGVYKDGTSRYDATDLPLTSFRPNEVGATVEDLKELGYSKDLNGDPLENEDQLVELKIQDLVIPERAGEYLLKVANFIDDLLEKYYDLEPHYNAETPEDLIGELIIGMAPHTSAGALGRIIGYTDAWGQYAHPFFHAAKRRNCFHPNETLHYQVEHENGETEWKYGTIEELVENHLDADNLETDDFGSEYSTPTKTIRVPSITDDGEQVLKELNKVQRNPATDHMVTFETENGKEITVTPDHEMLVYENGEQTKAPAREVEEGDKFLEPTHLDTIDGNTNQEFDLLKELAEADEVDNYKLTIAHLTEDEVKTLYEQAFGVNTDNGYLAELRDRFDMSKKTISNYVYRGNTPAGFLLKGFDSVDKLCEAVPDGAELGWKRNDVTANRFVELDDTLATFLGYYAAEGFTRDQDGGAFQTTISATEDEARDFATKAFYDCFGVEAYEQNEHKITASSAIFQQAMKHVFDAEDHSHLKKVPECIMTTSDEQLVGDFLGGYISGDGHISDDSVCVGTTVSERLKTDLLALLDRLSIECSVETEPPVDLHKRFPDYYDKGEKKSKKLYRVKVRGSQVHKLTEHCKIHLTRKDEKASKFTSEIQNGTPAKEYGDSEVVEVDSKEIEESDAESTYNVEVADTNKLVVSRQYSKNCDSDEDAFMLALDGLLNYSEHYLNHHKSGWSMDEPIVMNKLVDPTEIDDEAHNVDIESLYSREFYEATMVGKGPKDVDVEIAEDRLDDPQGFKHALSTESIDGGPMITEYKTLPDMDAKIHAQFDISTKARGVIVRDVAEKVIDGHFLADLKGNLRAFGEQSVRCTSCHHNHRRPPLDGVCKRCGDDSSWTINVHEGSVTKYLDNMHELTDEYEISNYIRQVIDEYDRSIESLFEDDKDKQTGLGDFV